MRNLYLLLSATLLALPATKALGHSEKDKKRYVAEQGVDTGFCDNPIRPCKTISYAVQRANKGDRVLVASGNYELTSSEEIFYLKSELVPILAGFNRFDHFQAQSPNVNQTFISGVPANMVDSLSERGFTVIRDIKRKSADRELQKKLEAVEALSKSQAEIACVNGSAGGFPCNNIDLVAHMPLNAFSGGQPSGNDIWGHVDLNSGIEYAIMGLQRGVAVVSLENPESPVEVGLISGSSATWRDIKVYQYFDETSSNWKAYAYVTVDGASDGVTIVDLNDLPNSISLVERNQAVGNAHNVYISNVDHTLNIALEGEEATLQLVGSRSNFNGSFHSFSLESPSTISIKNNQVNTNGYTHDGASTLIKDSRVNNDCVNGTQTCTVFVDFNENEMKLWDISDPTDSRLLSSSTYSDVSSSNQYIHSGWVTEDTNYVLIHDEFDENRGGLNSTVRIFNITNLELPVQTAQWTGPTRAIDHNGFVRGNRHYMSNYERGLTVLDITNPANPQEIGFFDTFPSSDNASFNGAWGAYPYLPSGLILVSDINSGLYVLRDNTQSTIQGSAKFSSPTISVNRGEQATIEVARVNAPASATSATVKYEMISGSASSSSDFPASTGTLSWNGNDSSTKTITLDIPADSSGMQESEVFFVRLFDPQSGLSLTSPSYLTVTINGAPNAGAIEFSTSASDIIESNEMVEITVNRVGGSEGEASVDYETSDGSALAGADYTAANGTLTWADGETQSQSIQISINNDADIEDDESFSVTLSSATGATIGSNSIIDITILDVNSNTVPEINAGGNFEANTGQTVSLSVTATDAEGDELSYRWEQISGTSVTIINDEQANASFVAPSAATDLTFNITVADIRGGTAEATVQVKIVAPPAPSSSSGGGTMGVLSMLIFGLTFRKKFTMRNGK